MGENGQVMHFPSVAPLDLERTQDIPLSVNIDFRAAGLTEDCDRVLPGLIGISGARSIPTASASTSLATPTSLAVEEEFSAEAATIIESRSFDIVTPSAQTKKDRKGLAIRVRRVKGYWIARTTHSERYSETYVGLGRTVAQAMKELSQHLNDDLPLAEMSGLPEDTPGPQAPAARSAAHHLTRAVDGEEPLFLEEQLRLEGAFYVPNRARRPS